MAGIPELCRLPLNDGNDQFAIAIAERHLRPQQIRSAHVPAAQVRAMAGSAGDAVKLVPAFDLSRVAGRPLLSRNESAALSFRC